MSGVDVKVNATVKMTPETLAEAWWDMDSEQQAAFFAHLATLAPSHVLEMQALYIREAVCKAGPAARGAALTFTGMIYRYGLLNDPVEEWMVDGVEDAKREIAGMVDRAKRRIAGEVA